MLNDPTSGVNLPEGEALYDVWERDGAAFRRRVYGPDDRYVPIVEEVLHSRWTPYQGDCLKPAMFGEYLGRKHFPKTD